MQFSTIALCLWQCLARLVHQRTLSIFFHSSFHILLSYGLCTVRGALLGEWFAFIPCVSLLSSVGTLSMLLMPWFGNYVFFL